MSQVRAQKVLLMGRAGSGKTSMRSIIFANYMARDTMRLTPTLDVEHSQVRFLGNLVLNLWDCGGQFAFYENYFDSQRDAIFREVGVLIYVFDIESTDLEQDLTLFGGVIEAIEQGSPDARVFVLIHKMDLIVEQERSQSFENRSNVIRSKAKSLANSITFFGTSIWDETLYKAWSKIISSMIPNTKLLERYLNDLCLVCSADEAVLFERATFLVLGQSNPDVVTAYDAHRFERISNIIKQFKLCCNRITSSSFSGLELEYNHYDENRKVEVIFSAMLESFTANTFILMVSSKRKDAVLYPAINLANIQCAKQVFERIIPMINNEDV